MWQGQALELAKVGFVPDSFNDDELAIVYDEPDAAEELEEEHMAPQRARHANMYAQSTSKPPSGRQSADLPPSPRRPGSSAGKRGRSDISPDRSDSASPLGRGQQPGEDDVALSFVQQVQTLLQDMSQQPNQQQQCKQQEAEAAPAKRRPGSGRRVPLHNYPAAEAAFGTAAGAVGGTAAAAGCAQAEDDEEEEGVGRVRRSGRRWRPQGRQQQAKQPQQPWPGQREQQVVPWDSGTGPPRQLQAGAAAADATPAGAPRNSNPLGALLGSGNTASAGRAAGKAAATTGKLKGRNPLYHGVVGGSQPGSQGKGTPGPTAEAGNASRTRQQGPLTSPRPRAGQPANGRRQQLHRLYGSGSTTPGPAGVLASQLGLAPSSTQQQAADTPGPHAAATTASGMRLLLGGSTTAGVGSRQRQAAWQQKRGQALQLAPASESIVDEPDEAYVQQQQQRHAEAGQQAASPGAPVAAAAGAVGAAAAADASTPGLHRLPGVGLPLHSMYRPPPSSAFGRPPGSSGTPGAEAVAGTVQALGSAPAAGRAGAGAGLSLQRQFIAQLAPVSRPAVAPTHQQRQRLAGAAGLYGRLQAILAAEKAEVQMGQRQAAAGAGPRLTVLRKELDCSLTRCLCSCDAAPAEFGGAQEVVAFLQPRTAREVDTLPGCVLVLRRPWRLLQLAGCHWPVVLCYSVEQG